MDSRPTTEVSTAMTPSTLDTLTGVLHRAAVHAALQARIEAVPTLGPVAAVAVDLDDFRNVNATLGHYVGDRILIEVARRLGTAVSEPILGRAGGDEFIVAFSARDEDDALTGAQAIADALFPSVEVLGYQVALHASMGAVLAPQHLATPAPAQVTLTGLPADSDASRLLKLADDALLRARREKSGVALHRPFDEEARIRRLMLVHELREAVPRQELELRLQPVVDLRAGRVIGAEALVRWRHADHGLMLPDEFIELAELSGSIHALTRWLVGETLHASRSLSDRGLPLVMSANLSVRNVLDPDLGAFFTGLVEEGSLDPGRLVLEITETELLHDPARGAAIVERLRRLGIATVVDDFGTGYSSLSYLRQLPVSGLKIDRSFVMGLPDDPTNMAIVGGIVEMAHRLGLTVTAEGVADAASFEAVVALDIDFAQGFHLCPPVTVDDLPEHLAELDTRLAGLVPPLA